ncbi:MAG TPA: right-handed parallel beta-helix repeat-containing protein, partial [Anaerolineales bacterium]
MKNIVTIDGAAVAAEITGFTITGPGPSGCGSINSGLMVRGGADLNLHDNAISDIRDEPLSGCQNGQGIWVGRTAMATTGTATITNNVFSGYQKGGIVVDNVGSSAVITGNTVTGVGPTAAIAMNGIQVSRGATATVTGNTVSGHDYTGAEGAVGILLYQAGSPTNIGPNTSVTSNELGIWTDMQHTVGTMNLSGVTGNVRDAVADFTGWSAPVGTYADDDFSTGIVDADGGDIVDIAGASLHVLGWDAFATIQAAVDAASDGDTVNVAAGTYDEQVVIDGISLTLDGAGDTTVIQPADPAKLISIYTLGTQDAALFNGMKLASIVNVMNVGAAGVTIKDLKINGVDVDALPAGANYVVGLSYGETGGQISNVSVLNMNSVPAATRTYGMWLDAVGGTALDVEVLNSTIQFFNRNGLNARGNSLTVNIHDSLVDGGGPVAGQVLNGILLINGAGGQIVNNEIHDNSYVGDTWKGSGVLLYQTIPGILISENEIYATDDAIIINATNSAT